MPIDMPIDAYDHRNVATSRASGYLSLMAFAIGVTRNVAVTRRAVLIPAELGVGAKAA